MNTVDCLLSCGCWMRMRVDLAVREALETCPRHGESYTARAYFGSIPLVACDVYVVKVNDREWHVRCQESGCNYGRWFGQSEGLARRANGKHATAHDHIGGVAYDKVTLDGAGTVYHYPSVSGRRKSSPKQPRKLVKLVPETVPPPF